jgi:hypothetical protein
MMSLGFEGTDPEERARVNRAVDREDRLRECRTAIERLPEGMSKKELTDLMVCLVLKANSYIGEQELFEAVGLGVRSTNAGSPI